MKYLFLFWSMLSFLPLISQEKPNILWITIEDTSPQFIGCYGDSVASTPHIDQLAREGIRFTNAFSTGTVCSPSRSAIITGVPTFKLGTGHHRSNYSIPDTIYGFPSYLKKAGYYTSNNYKTDYNVANEKAMIESSWNESSGEAGWWKRQDGQPFFSVFNINHSHQSRTMTMPYEWYEKHVTSHLSPDEMIREDEVVLPPFYRDTPAMRKQYVRVYNSIKLTDNRVGEIIARLKKDQLYENTIIFFFADHGEGIPRGKTNGINLGYRVPFIIRVPDKFKKLASWEEKVSDELISFEDLAPTVLELAGIEKPSYLKGKILCGENKSDPRDLLFLSSDRADNGIDLVRSVTDGRFIYSRNFMPYMPEIKHIRYVNIGDITQEMRKDYRDNKLDSVQSALFIDRPLQILYDLNNDLWEVNNLVYEPKHQPLVNKLASFMNATILEEKDILFMPEYLIDKISEKQAPYDYRQEESKYDIEKILSCAQLLLDKGGASIAQLVENLGSEDPSIAYWAGVGLFSLPDKSIDAYRSAIEAEINSPLPMTSIYASAVAYKHFASQLGESKLNAYVQSDNPHLSLHTINLLLYLKNSRPFTGSVSLLRDREGLEYKVKAAALDFLTIHGLEDPSLQE